MLSSLLHSIASDERLSLSMVRLLVEKHNPTCPHCKAEDLNWIENSNRWRCIKCRRYKSLKSSTIMKYSKLPLSTWIKAIAFILEGKGQLSSSHLRRKMNLKRYEPVWYMYHKLRTSMSHIVNKSLDLSFFVCNSKTRLTSRIDRYTFKDHKAVSFSIGLNQDISLLLSENIIKPLNDLTSPSELANKTKRKCLKQLSKWFDLLTPSFRLSKLQSPDSTTLKLSDDFKHKIINVHRKTSARYFPLYVNEFNYFLRTSNHTELDSTDLLFHTIWSNPTSG